LTQKEELVACLQQELVKVRLREAENEALIRDLKDHIMELEEVLYLMKSLPLNLTKLISGQEDFT
jgi:hypothetical protein